MRKWIFCLVMLTGTAHAVELYEVMQYMPDLPEEYKGKIDFGPIIPAVQSAKALSAKKHARLPLTDEEKVRWIFQLRNVYGAVHFSFIRLSSRFGGGGLPWNAGTERTIILNDVNFVALIVDQSLDLESGQQIANETLTDLPRLVGPTPQLSKPSWKEMFREIWTGTHDHQAATARIYETLWREHVAKYLRAIEQAPVRLSATERCEIILKLSGLLQTLDSH